MLHAITNWSELQRVLEACDKALYVCEDCDHVWLGQRDPEPPKCANHDCRALRSSFKQKGPGRPRNT